MRIRPIIITQAIYYFFKPPVPIQTPMKKILILATCLCLMALMVMPAQAFTMNSLSINLDQAGDAQIDVTYELTLIEQSAVFLRLADPASELQSAFNSGSSEPTTVTSASSSSAQVIVPSFARVTTTGGKTVMTTPTVSFERAENVLKNYWFAPLVTADFSPSVTTITFPDGHKEYYYDQISIPTVTHQISG